MLQQHVEQGADVTVGCIEVPRLEATGFGVMARRRDRPHRRRSSKSPRTRPACPASPIGRSPAWASTCSTPSFLFDQLRRDAADPHSSHDFGKDIIPYLVKHGKAVAHRFANPACGRRVEAEAYWRDVGTVDAYWEANIDLTDVVPALDLYDQRLADLDLWRDHAAGEVRARRRRPARPGDRFAGLGRLHRLRRVARRSLLFTGVHVHSYCHVEDAVILPYVDDRPLGAALRTSWSTAGVKIPEGLVVGEDPELDAQRFRRTESGICLITQPMIDQLGELTERRCASSSVASELFPLVKTGGLADVAGALPGALAREGVAFARSFRAIRPC